MRPKREIAAPFCRFSATSPTLRSLCMLPAGKLPYRAGLKMLTTLQDVRSQYLARFHEVLEDCLSNGLQVVAEIRLELPSLQRRHPLFRQYVVDLLERLPNDENRILEIQANPSWPQIPGVNIDAPLVWNGVQFRCDPASFRESTLVAWGDRWISDERPPLGSQDNLTGIIHSIMEPTSDSTFIEFSVDFGSAPLEAFHELLDGLRSSLQSIGSYAIADGT